MSYVDFRNSCPTSSNSSRKDIQIQNEKNNILNQWMDEDAKIRKLHEQR